MNTLSWHNRSAESLEQSPSPKRNGLDVSGYSLRLQQNAETKREGETMFDFLKRRKRFAIEQCISKNNRSRCQPPTDRSVVVNQAVDESLSKQKKSTIIDSRDEKMSTLSSKRVTFRESEAMTSGQPTGRSFFDVVSPFKKRLSKHDSFQSDDNCKENINANSARKLRGKELTVQKRALFSNLERLGIRIEHYCKNVSNFRSKGQAVYIDSLSCLTEREASSTDKLLKRYQFDNHRKLEELRKDAKTADRLFGMLEELDAREDLEEIKRELNNNLNLMEAQLRRQYQDEMDMQLRRRESLHREAVADLDSKLKKAVKELAALEHKLEKQDVQSSQESTMSAKVSQQRMRRQEERNQSMERQVQALQAENEQVLSELVAASDEIKGLEKEVKSLRAEKSSLLKSFDIEKEEIAARKQTYLLEEMTKLKKQFQSDMDQLTDLYRLKEVELFQKLHAQQTTIQDYQRKLPGYLKAEEFFQEQIQGLRGQLDRHKAQVEKQFTQNDQLLRQLHHSNDQACLYWTALKDLKTLSSRLGLFGKLARVYEDINFRDGCFR